MLWHINQYLSIHINSIIGKCPPKLSTKWSDAVALSRPAILAVCLPEIGDQLDPTAEFPAGFGFLLGQFTTKQHRLRIFWGSMWRIFNGCSFIPRLYKWLVWHHWILRTGFLKNLWKLPSLHLVRPWEDRNIGPFQPPIGRWLYGTSCWKFLNNTCFSIVFMVAHPMISQFCWTEIVGETHTTAELVTVFDPVSHQKSEAPRSCLRHSCERLSGDLSACFSIQKRCGQAIAKGTWCSFTLW